MLELLGSESESKPASPAASTQSGVGDICQEIADHGTAVTGAVGSAREFGIAAVIGFRCRDGCTTAGCRRCNVQDFLWMRKGFGEYKVVWKGL